VSDPFKTATPFVGQAEAMSEHDLRRLPNIGPRMAAALIRLGIDQPGDLRGQDPGELWRRLGELDGRLPDPCVLDTFTAVVDHAEGAPARPWWLYSRERKEREAARQPAGRPR
jgi:nucleotidyltransferase/DNA polymerase involved in DNA repair